MPLRSHEYGNIIMLALQCGILQHYDVDISDIIVCNVFMDGLKVLEVVKKINSWYKDGKVPEAKLESFRRREFTDLHTDLTKLDLITLIIGARRVGKSVLMYQLIDNLLQNGVDPKQILFIQGDNTLLNEYAVAGNLISYILDLYQKHILEIDFGDLDKPVYIFLDEAQSINAWDREIKTIVDQKYKIKFIVTGSSSFELRRGAENPLTGRVSFHPISPFSFADYLRYKISTFDDLYQTKVKNISKDFKRALLDGNVDLVFSNAQTANNITTKYKLKDNLDKYLFYGGFPHVVTKDDEDHSKYLRDLLTSTISKDILTNVEIRDPQAFERLMVNLCLMVGNATKYKKYADVLNIDERSVIKYINYYVETHWVSVSSQFEFSNRLTSASSDKKFYILDTGVVNILSFKDFDEFKNDTAYRGHLIENMIHNHLLSFKQEHFGLFQNSISHWIENQNSKEIDFIFEIKNGVLPIEVKSKISYDGTDEDVLAQFLSKRRSAKFAILTTENTLDKHDNILLIPNYLLAMLL